MDGRVGCAPKTCTPPAVRRPPFCVPRRVTLSRFSMFDKLKEMYAQSPRPIFVTGHSLGAALATIAAARIAVDHDLPLTALYTVGSPRCARAALGVRLNYPRCLFPRSKSETPLFVFVAARCLFGGGRDGVGPCRFPPRLASFRFWSFARCSCELHSALAPGGCHLGCPLFRPFSPPSFRWFTSLPPQPPLFWGEEGEGHTRRLAPMQPMRKQENGCAHDHGVLSSHSSRLHPAHQSFLAPPSALD